MGVFDVFCLFTSTSTSTSSHEPRVCYKGVCLKTAIIADRGLILTENDELMICGETIEWSAVLYLYIRRVICGRLNLKLC